LLKNEVFSTLPKLLSFVHKSSIFNDAKPSQLCSQIKHFQQCQTFSPLFTNQMFSTMPKIYPIQPNIANINPKQHNE